MSFCLISNLAAVITLLEKLLKNFPSKLFPFDKFHHFEWKKNKKKEEEEEEEVGKSVSG